MPTMTPSDHQPMALPRSSGGERVEHEGLRDGDQGRCEHALQKPIHDDFPQAFRRTGEHRGDAKADGGDQEQAPATPIDRSAFP